MRILLVNGSLYGGGAEHVIATLARHYREAGHHVLIAVVHDGDEIQRELVAEGFEVVSRLAEGRGGLVTTRRIRQLLEKQDIHVIHSHDLRSLVDTSFHRLLPGHRAAHFHTFHFGNYPHLPRKELLLEAAFCRIPDRLVAVGHVQREGIVKALRLPPRRVHVVWNGVDRLALTSPDSDRRSPNAVPLIGSVSTFGPQKGLNTLLEAAHLLKRREVPFRLMLVGEGPMRQQLELYVHTMGLREHVEFTGWRSDAATALIPTFDVFVQSSHWEAMSIVILEAMASRRAIVATNVGENERVLRDQVSALLVPPRSSEALADNLTRVLLDPALRERLAAAASDDYRRHFTGATMAAHYLAAYQQVLLEPKFAAATSMNDIL